MKAESGFIFFKKHKKKWDFWQERKDGGYCDDWGPKVEVPGNREAKEDFSGPLTFLSGRGAGNEDANIVEEA